jgi:tripartite-type tricarboxylate transporter receptor subunit TctC
MNTFLPTRRALGLIAALAVTGAAPALAWTDKPVRMIVPAPAGGTMDVVARLLAEQMTAEIGQPVVVDNKPGAGGAIAVQALLGAPADGQTVMVTASNVLTEIPHVLKMPFDPLKDLRPVAAVVRSGVVLVAGPSVPAADLKGAVAYAKANPGKLSFASYSAGTSSHYAGMIFNQKTGLDLAHVPFAGSPPALQQVMGGQIAVMFDGMATSLPQIKAGKLKPLGVAAQTRSTHLPDVPTLAEQGLADLDFSNWVGVVAAGSLPEALAEKIQAVVVKAAAAPKLRERFLAVGFEVPAPQSPAQLAQSVRSEFDRNAAIVKTFGIKLD